MAVTYFIFLLENRVISYVFFFNVLRPQYSKASVLKLGLVIGPEKIGLNFRFHIRNCHRVLEMCHVISS